MYCNKCGKEIDDEALICPYCGCGTVNYIRDQAKAESRAREHRQPAQKKRSTALLRLPSLPMLKNSAPRTRRFVCSLLSIRSPCTCTGL